MTTDFRALCADLLWALENAIRVIYHEDGTKHISTAKPIVNRARAALADEPAVPEVVGSEWQPCVKLPITVHVREQRPGEQHVSTREGITPVQPDDLIMLGVDGEEYPIGRELFQRTYRMGSADEPAVPEGREPVAVTEQPSDEELALIYHDCCRGCEFMDQGGFENAARAVLARWGLPAPAPPAEVSQLSDGYHTFAELYEHRHSLMLALMRALPRICWFSRRHSDGELPFGSDDWFIVGAELPGAPITYHLPAALYSLAQKTGALELPAGRPWDGHSAADVVHRLRDWAIEPAPPADGEVAELVRMLTGIAHWRRRGRPGECDPSPFDIRQADRLARAAELLERQVLVPTSDAFALVQKKLEQLAGNQEMMIYRWPDGEWSIDHSNPLPHVQLGEVSGEHSCTGRPLEEVVNKIGRTLEEVVNKIAALLPAHAALAEADEPAAPLPLADTHYEWELEDAEGEWQAGGSSNSQSDVEREGRHYLQTYAQDGPHKLIIRQHTTQTINEITNDH